MLGPCAGVASSATAHDGRTVYGFCTTQSDAYYNNCSDEPTRIEVMGGPVSYEKCARPGKNWLGSSIVITGARDKVLRRLSQRVLWPYRHNASTASGRPYPCPPSTGSNAPSPPAGHGAGPQAASLFTTRRR
ncbi:DUF6355 family natural product biosynthesis protein [Streptomyces roseus]|uniref:DUF6355 family natural product biosynthesis protein n=1 Tax=Streptomyces roseus TaxID=66430 RepID=UPI003807A191